MSEVWGIWDTKDNLWLGGDKGPNLFRDIEVDKSDVTLYATGKELARLAAQIASDMIGTDPLRVRPRLYTAKSVRLKDEIKARKTGEEAIKHLEERGL